MTTMDAVTALGYHCFGCSPDNERGLQLEFRSTDDGIEADLLFDRSLESHPTTVHGGILMTVCDELMGNALLSVAGLRIVTTSMRTRFVSPVRVGVPYLGVAAVGQRNVGSLYQATAEILDKHGDPVVIANATYQRLIQLPTQR